jgi:phage-related baseplate assembly protein
MPLTLEQLRTPVTADEALQTILDNLEALGFNTTSWQSGSVQRTFVQMFALVYADWTTYVDFISRFAFNEDSSAGALTEFSDSHYDNQRIVNVNTVGNYTFSGAAIGPPHVIAASDMVVADANGVTFRNTTGGTIPQSGTLVVTIQAEVAGTGGNVANNTIDTIQTPLAGVTGNNPPIAPATTWITTQGLDEEADAVLQARNTSKWATLSLADPAEAYENMALTADTDITRVLVVDTNPRGAGTLDVYIARATGAAVGADVTTVQAYIDDRRPVTADPEVIAAAAAAQAFTATIYVTAALNNAAKQAEIEAALATFINGIDIGGKVLPGGTQGYMLFSELNQAVSEVVGVENITWTTPTADVAIVATQIMTVGAVTFTYTDI